MEMPSSPNNQSTPQTLLHAASLPDHLCHTDYDQKCTATILGCADKSRKQRRKETTDASTQEQCSTTVGELNTDECVSGNEKPDSCESLLKKRNSRSSGRGPSLNVSKKFARMAASKPRSHYNLRLRSYLRTAPAQHARRLKGDDHEQKCDADCQTIRTCSREATNKIMFLKDFKSYLKSEIQKTEVIAEIANMTPAITMKDALRAVAGDSAANESESHVKMLKEKSEDPRVEYKVYTLTSIHNDQQVEKSSISSKRSLRKGDNTGSFRNSGNSSKMLPNALKPARKYYNSLQPTLSHFMRRMERTKAALAKGSSLSISDGKKSENVFKTGTLNMSIMSSENQQHKLGNRKASKFSLHSSSSKSKKTIPRLPKNEQMVKIEELDLDIQNEITRLQKLRKILDAKAKLIIQKEESSNHTSGVRNNTRVEYTGDSLTSRKSRNSSSLNGRDDKLPTQKQTLVDAKLAKKVEKTVQKAKKAADAKRDDQQTDEQLVNLKSTVAENDCSASVTVYKLLEDVESTVSRTPDSEDRSSGLSHQPLAAEHDQYGSQKQDLADGTCKHQDLIQWLQGLFTKEKKEGQKEGELDSTKGAYVSPFIVYKSCLTLQIVSTQQNLR